MKFAPHKTVKGFEQKLEGIPQIPDSGIHLPTVMHTLQEEFIRQALAKFENNRGDAARFLGIGRTTLVEKMRKHGMPLNKPCVPGRGK